jgi:hypothetical protein
MEVMQVMKVRRSTLGALRKLQAASRTPTYVMNRW